MIYCGFDLYDPNMETATVQSSLSACINDCEIALSGQCPGITWVPNGQAQQYCYYKPASELHVPTHHRRKD